MKEHESTKASADIHVQGRAEVKRDYSTIWLEWQNKQGDIMQLSQLSPVYTYSCACGCTELIHYMYVIISNETNNFHNAIATIIHRVCL